jgi:hypothetical protein
MFINLSIVGIALGYGLNDWGSRVQFLVGSGKYSLHHCIQNGSGAHPASCPVGTSALSLGVKWPGHEADHSPLSSAKVKRMCGAIPPFSQYAFMAWCLVKKSTGTTLPFTFITMNHTSLKNYSVLSNTGTFRIIN